MPTVKAGFVSILVGQTARFYEKTHNCYFYDPGLYNKSAGDGPNKTKTCLERRVQL